MAEQKNIIWEHAGVAGLALGGVSILYLVLSMLIGKLAEGTEGSILLNLLNIVLWLAKFSGCIFLMRFFMLRYAQADPAADNARVFRFGTRTALLSALLYAGFYLAYTTYLAPDLFQDAMSMMEDFPMFDANSRDQMEAMLPKMPTISFFVTLIYCWLFGTILSAILSRNIPPKNPFTDQQ